MSPATLSHEWVIAFYVKARAIVVNIARARHCGGVGSVVARPIVKVAMGAEGLVGESALP